MNHWAGEKGKFERAVRVCGVTTMDTLKKLLIITVPTASTLQKLKY